MPPAARKTDLTEHGPPLSAPGPGSLDIDIGYLPAWRALPAGVGDGLEKASEKMKEMMDKSDMTPADGTPLLIEAQAGATQAAGAAAANGNAAAAGAVSAAFATAQAANVTLTAAYAAAVAVGAESAGKKAYTEGIKAAAGAAATAAFSAIGAGICDIHNCTIPVPPAPHGPGIVTKGSSSVLFNNLPAAREGDKVFEALGGPDAISKGEATVEIGD